MISARSSRRVVPGVLAALALLPACGSPVAESVSLSALRGRTLQFALTDVDSLERPSTTGAYRVTVVFSPGEGCVQLLDGVRASLNGQPMTLLPGGLSGSGSRATCESPRATYDFDPAQWAGGTSPEDLRLTLRDDSHTVEVVLAAARTKRRFVRADGMTGNTLRRGERHSYAWQPVSDTVVDVLKVSLTPREGGLTTNLPVSQAGNTGAFLVPEASTDGEYVLRLDGTATVGVSACTGVAACEGGVVHSEELVVTVAR
ncbi:hypothetical protein [Archangium primigenium]|uniref:hypothetical protein n=1 Tax=[Archangium] primigenium TaxID=2792470 RepID=UPI00195DAEB0|nr:hypothetical protein [Archangium primigenium]MBM7119024.1 hypothetical protein [Archangium primigenium]